MSLLHYVSYAPADGAVVARWLTMTLPTFAPSIAPWFGERDVRNNDNAAEEADEALRSCKSVVLLLTAAASSDDSRVVSEWRRAISYNKPITILLVAPDLRVPFRLQNRRTIDFTGDHTTAMHELASRLLGIDTPEGQIVTLTEQLKDAQRDLDYASAQQKLRIEAEMQGLQQQIESVSRAVTGAEDVPRRIALGLDRERQPPPPTDKTSAVRFVNAPPAHAPRWFQDRFVETRLIGEFVRDNGARLLTISGRGGVGKTALVCRVLNALQNGALPDDGGQIAVGGIVYLSSVGTRPISFPVLFDDLLRLVPAEARLALATLAENPQASVAMKINALLPHLPRDPVLVLMDNFEDNIDLELRRIRDAELLAALRVLAEHTEHPLKVMVTTRIDPRDFAEFPVTHRMTISLDEGLPSPFAEHILREMDSDGHVGLQGANEDTLTQIRSYTRGFPRALEAFYAILACDRDITIAELLSAERPPERIVQVLVGDAFARLLPGDQAVMQALAVYGHPVSVTAVDYLLQPWMSYIDSGPALKRLANMYLVRKERGGYYLHPIDREHALSRLQADGVANGLSRRALVARAADYYHELRKEKDEWKTLRDVEPHVREFYLRLDVADEDSAAEILTDLKDFFDGRGAFTQLNEMAVALSVCASSTDAAQAALSCISASEWRAGRLDKCIEAQQRLIDRLLEDEAPAHDVFVARLNLVIFKRSKGPTEEIVHDLRDALHTLEKDYPFGVQQRMIILQQLNSTLGALGYVDEALVKQQEATSIAQSLGEVDGIEAQTHNLGQAYENVGDIERALELCREALRMADESGNPLWRANHLDAIGHCLLQEGLFDEAIRHMTEALSIREEIGDLGGCARTTRDLALAYLEIADDRALKTATRAYDSAKELGQPLASFETACATILLHLGRVSEAQTFARRALQNPERARWEYENLYGIVAFRNGSHDAASGAFRRALDGAETWIRRSTHNTAAHAAKALALAGLFACGETSDPAAAIDAYVNARRVSEAPGNILSRLRRFDELTKGSQQVALAQIRRAITGARAEHQVELAAERTQVFISYARRDSEWLERLKRVLAPLVRNHTVDLWDDERIRPGQAWHEEITNAMKRARIAVLLVSPNFLHSEYINREELPFMIAAAERDKVSIVWVPIAASLYEETALLHVHAAHDPARPLNTLPEGEVDRCLVAIAKKIKDEMRGPM
ncbi:MAG: hypothetical protein QOC81_385 [Thermoanaerobaculia bacterium]|jgi:tetratricopeptide (TPR) repeat protein|nr:hypothetical protein [Thermoanaerobaculia bacterium]